MSGILAFSFKVLAALPSSSVICYGLRVLSLPSFKSLMEIIVIMLD